MRCPRPRQSRANEPAPPDGSRRHRPEDEALRVRTSKRSPTRAAPSAPALVTGSLARGGPRTLLPAGLARACAERPPSSPAGVASLVRLNPRFSGCGRRSAVDAELFGDAPESNPRLPALVAHTTAETQHARRYFRVAGIGGVTDVRPPRRRQSGRCPVARVCARRVLSARTPAVAETGLHDGPGPRPRTQAHGRAGRVALAERPNVVCAFSEVMRPAVSGGPRGRC
jgi:hypothetical protein